MIGLALAFIAGIGADAGLTLLAVKMIRGSQEQMAKSAVEDFQEEIIKAVPGLLAKALEGQKCLPSE